MPARRAQKLIQQIYASGEPVPHAQYTACFDPRDSRPRYDICEGETPPVSSELYRWQLYDAGDSFPVVGYPEFSPISQKLGPYAN